MRDATEAEAREHDRHDQEGWKLIRGEILLAGARVGGAPGWFARRRLTKAIGCFEAAAADAPGGAAVTAERVSVPEGSTHGSCATFIPLAQPPSAAKGNTPGSR